MFIAYVVFAILGILLGIFVFFFGLALFGVYMKSAKADLETSRANGEIETEEKADDGERREIVEEKRELTEEEIKGRERRKKMFTCLPTLLGVEGASLFIFNFVMIILKFKIQNFVEFYVLLAVDAGVILLSLLINSLALSKYKDEKDVEKEDKNTENGIDKID